MVDPATNHGGRSAVTLTGATVVFFGGTSGIGLETARLARADGARVILTGRNQDRLRQTAEELGAEATGHFDATDFAAVTTFLDGLERPVDHIFVTAGSSYYAPVPDIDFAAARTIFEEKLWLALTLARIAPGLLTPGGSLLFTSGTAPRRPARGVSIPAASVGAMTAVTRNLALELAPIRFNLIAAGFLDTPLSASVLGAGLDDRRRQLRAELPIGRVVDVAEVAALAAHIMANGAITGATFDIDGGEQLLPAVEGRPPEAYAGNGSLASSN